MEKFIENKLCYTEPFIFTAIDKHPKLTLIITVVLAIALVAVGELF